ncbi:hypothetical protein O3M35_007499 [Rhynocoris fuscipes]|uniref:Uncharacterized protein n=1 Tax=Rhynocoris fuscipes TaxID=488301 RepID=A0AAW1DFD0_9HEMI
MFNSMYPMVHLTSQNNPHEGRQFTGTSPIDFFHIVNGDMPYTQQKDFLLHAHSAINLTNNGKQQMIASSNVNNCKTFYNKSNRDNWSSNRNNGKSKRLQHGLSAPCLTSTPKDDSSDSGLSRSPTPSRRTNNGYFNQSSSNEKMVEAIDGKKKTNKRSNEVNTQVASQSNNRHQQGRNEIQIYPKRRVNYARNTPFNFRLRRLSSLTLQMSTPFPQSSMMTPYCTAPDRFLLRSHLMQIKHIPEELTDGSIWDQLSQSIWKRVLLNQQTEETYKRKMALWKYLYVTIKSYFPKYGLYMVGSTMNGFGIESSDVDMCLLIRHAEVDQRNEALSYLNDILNLFSQSEYLEKLELIQAKVPILKFRDSKQGMQVDLNCNNSVGIRNTHLLYCYGRMDWRVRPLVMIVKLWAHWHNINDAKNMTLSSYSLALMVIHFLQCGVNPPILCCLHSMYKEKFNSNSDIGSIDIHEELDPFISENKQSLGELLMQFFQYYSTFDFLHYAISVRLASVIPIEECRMVRMPKNDPHQWKLLCIEEPFDLTNTARSVYDPEKFKHIRNTFARSAQALQITRTLESIFNKSFNGVNC